MTPTDCLYHKEHLWVSRNGESEVSIGVTDHAQDMLGEVVYIETAEVGGRLVQGTPFGIIESVKITSDLIAPISGTVRALNAALPDDPSCVNRAPYREGWLLQVTLADASELDSLMSAEEYDRFLNDM